MANFASLSLSLPLVDSSVVLVVDRVVAASGIDDWGGTVSPDSVVASDLPLCSRTGFLGSGCWRKRWVLAGLGLNGGSPDSVPDPGGKAVVFELGYWGGGEATRDLASGRRNGGRCSRSISIGPDGEVEGGGDGGDGGGGGGALKVGGGWKLEKKVRENTLGLGLGVGLVLGLVVGFFGFCGEGNGPNNKKWALNGGEEMEVQEQSPPALGE